MKLDAAEVLVKTLGRDGSNEHQPAYGKTSQHPCDQTGKQQAQHLLALQTHLTRDRCPGSALSKARARLPQVSVLPKPAKQFVARDALDEVCSATMKQPPQRLPRPPAELEQVAR